MADSTSMTDLQFFIGDKPHDDTSVVWTRITGIQSLPASNGSSNTFDTTTFEDDTDQFEYGTRQNSSVSIPMIFKKDDLGQKLLPGLSASREEVGMRIYSPRRKILMIGNIQVGSDYITPAAGPNSATTFNLDINYRGVWMRGDSNDGLTII